MFKVLIYNSDITFLPKLQAMIGSLSFVENVTIVNDFDKCINHIKHEYFDFYIIDLDNVEIARKFENNLENITHLPVLITRDQFSFPQLTNYRKHNFNKSEFKLISFLNILSELLPASVVKSNQQLVSEFIPIQFATIRKIRKMPCEFYIRINKSKYVKIYNEDSVVNQDILDKYSIKNINEFYIKKADFYRCSDDLFASALPDINLFENKIEYFTQSQQVINEIFNDLGINENTLKVVNECVDKMLNETETPGLKDLINKFKYSQVRYIYDHSYLTSVFAITMCEKFSWRNTKNFEKIVFASFVHDYGFSNPKLAILENNYKHNQNLSMENKKDIFEHPAKMQKILAKDPSISSEVLSLILKHHEAHGDESYPAGLNSASLSPMECVFIVAHEFVNQLYKIAFRPDKMEKAINNVLEFSNNGNLKQVRTVFNETIAVNYNIKIS